MDSTVPLTVSAVPFTVTVAALTHIEARRIGGVEGHLQLHVIPVQHVGDDGADGDAVPAVHVQLGDHTGVVGLHIAVLLIVALGLQQVVEGQLGGLDVELELLDVVLHVAGVDAEEHVALVDGLPLLKGGLQISPLTSVVTL